jgi:anti-sigma28 factor (negative regulator of flagellin synthesis)
MTDECTKKCLIKDIEKNNCVCDVHKSPEQKVEDLKTAIANIGFKVNDTPEGDIIISE